MAPTRGDGLLTTAQAARAVGVVPATIRKWVQRARLSPWGLSERGHPLYRLADVRDAERLVRENGITASGIDPRKLRRRAA